MDKQATFSIEHQKPVGEPYIEEELGQSPEDLPVQVEREGREVAFGSDLIKKQGTEIWYAKLNDAKIREILSDWFLLHGQIPHDTEVEVRFATYGGSVELGAKRENGESTDFQFHRDKPNEFLHL